MCHYLAATQATIQATIQAAAPHAKFGPLPHVLIPVLPLFATISLRYGRAHANWAPCQLFSCFITIRHSPHANWPQRDFQILMLNLLQNFCCGLICGLASGWALKTMTIISHALTPRSLVSIWTSSGWKRVCMEEMVNINSQNKSLTC